MVLSENYNKTTAPRDILKLLEKNGWVEERIKGSHHVMKKDGKTEIIPVHGKDVPTGLLKTILKRIGLK